MCLSSLLYSFFFLYFCPQATCSGTPPPAHWHSVPVHTCAQALPVPSLAPFLTLLHSVLAELCGDAVGRFGIREACLIRFPTLPIHCEYLRTLKLLVMHTTFLCHRYPQFLVLNGMFAVGMALAANSLLAQAVMTVTHSPPSAADMAGESWPNAILLASSVRGGIAFPLPAVVCVSVGVLVQHFLPLVPPSASGKESTSLLPPAMFLLAGLFWLLQPELNALEVGSL